MTDVLAANEKGEVGNEGHIEAEVTRLAQQLTRLSIWRLLLLLGQGIAPAFQSLENLDIAEDFLIGTGLRYRRPDGMLASGGKQQQIHKFNASDSPYFAFMLSIRSGGVGINPATAVTESPCSKSRGWELQSGRPSCPSPNQDKEAEPEQPPIDDGHVRSQ
ncbi:Chromatin remodeling complex subunit (Chd3) [Penicillium bovifimosum]|uniref:Chromatin remodeling complex subunit (Chd3) n=1 Tax=Penicillium bovifimosum TaxID=126998 RepID=A0A9W9L927_9EURO|nr:Chromatin remodeling complex subunit (Chd3) [Penicillium bovifimosum]KAJ5143463.1 Chromatin remodeling complex subunit (Chd3) [Penicillium bovifimosum]